MTIFIVSEAKKYATIYNNRQTEKLEKKKVIGTKQKLRQQKLIPVRYLKIKTKKRKQLNESFNFEEYKSLSIRGSKNTLNNLGNINLSSSSLSM